MSDTNGYFFHHGGDHHSFVLFNSQVMDTLMPPRGDGDVTINQITWQTGSLAEVVNGTDYFREQEVPLLRAGRDMPGSNWHVYVYDPDGHINELYYGIEQVGWNALSKPREMYYRGFQEQPELPQMSEQTELEEAIRTGIDVNSGYRYEETLPADFEVEGVMLPRPFKITKVGPVNIFVNDLEASAQYYTDVLGFRVTEEINYRDQKVVFLRVGSEHHSLGLFPKEMRRQLGLGGHTTCLSFGVEVGSYEQLKNGVAFLKEKGVKFVEIPNELHPGIDYAAYAIDPEGTCIQIYCYMEQIGWDGKPRPAHERRPSLPMDQWPEAIEPLSDTFADQTFQGPLG
jgi:catechol 2,3-dioxygenase-like lactoylglutathione lyase family enzyme